MYNEPMTATAPPRTSGVDVFEHVSRPEGKFSKAPLVGPVGDSIHNSADIPKVNEDPDDSNEEEEEVG